MKRWLSFLVPIVLALLTPRLGMGQACGPMDVVFVIDDTGSMGNAIGNIKSQLSSIINDIATASGGDYRLGLVTFKDNVTVLDDLAAGNSASVSSHINALVATGGGGEPEASDEALNTVIHGLNASDRPGGQQTGDFGTFRTTALKIIVLVTDARPGGFTNTFNAANAHQRAVEAAAGGIKISAIYVPTGGSKPDIKAVMDDYAATTQGRSITTQEDGQGTAAAIQDIIASCGGSCAQVKQVSLLCATDPLKGFFYTFTVKNLTDGPVRHLFLLDLPAGVTATPNAIDFSDEPGGALAPGATSKARTVRIRGAGASPGGTVKFRFSMHDENLVECCAIEQTVQLPTCECAQILKGNVTCNLFLSGAPSFTYHFTLENLSPSPPPVSYVLVAPAPPATFTVSQSTQPISPPLGFGGDAVRQVTFSGPGAVFGGKACLRFSTHNQTLNECCSIERCIDLPSSLLSCPEIGPDIYTPVGDVNIFTSEFGLLVDGIGTSGEDGIKFDFGRTDSFRVGWRPFEPTPPDGAFVRFGATGAVNGIRDRPLGELKITDTGSALEITADYSDVGSTTQRLEIYRDGELVQTITGHRGPVARVPAWPTSCGKSLVEIGGHTTACYWPGWEDVIPIEIIGGPTVMGDGLRVLAENPAGDLDFLQTFTLRAASIPSITITGIESSTPGAGDLNLTLNTGFDQATGTTLPLGTLPEGTRDDDWGVLGATVPIPAKLVINRRAAWPAPLADSQWISVNPNQGRSTDARTISFENCFCIGDGAATADLSLRLRADDEATVFLNGTRIGGPGGGFRGAPLAVDLTGAVGASGPFRTGENCLRVEVNDLGGIVTGLNLTGTVRAAGGTCTGN